MARPNILGRRLVPSSSRRVPKRPLPMGQVRYHGKRGADPILFPDNDRSATSGRPRPGWQALLRAIEANEVDGLAAYSSSRLYRRPAELAPLIALVKDRPDFEIATVASGRIDLTTADGRMIAGILAEVDQAEVDKLKERVKRARRQRIEQGLYGGGKRPSGMTPRCLPRSRPRPMRSGTRRSASFVESRSRPSSGAGRLRASSPRVGTTGVPAPSAR